MKATEKKKQRAGQIRTTRNKRETENLIKTYNSIAISYGFCSKATLLICPFFLTYRCSFFFFFQQRNRYAFMVPSILCWIFFCIIWYLSPSIR